MGNISLMADKCPISFARLPAQIHSKDARALRKDLIQTPLTGDELFSYRKPAETETDYHTLRIESFATGSVVIEEFWKFLLKSVQERPLEIIVDDASLTLGQKFTKGFKSATSERANEFRAHAKDRMAKNTYEREDIILARFFDAFKKTQKVEEDVIPSVDEITAFVGRFADLIPKVFERDIGRRPTDDELFETLRKPSLKQIQVGLMSNERECSLGVLGLLEGHRRGDTSKLDRQLKPECFTLVRDAAGFEVVLRKELLERIHLVFSATEKKMISEGIPLSQSLHCPLLYTGLFNDMYEWTIEEFKKFYYAQKS